MRLQFAAFAPRMRIDERRATPAKQIQNSEQEIMIVRD